MNSLLERPRIDDLDPLEADMDQPVYTLYGLTKDEITLIEDRPQGAPNDIILP